MRDLLGKPLEITSLIDYQEASVVSKIILKKETGTVTLFAFDKGQLLSEHTAPFDALIYIADGKAEVTISGEANIVKSGEIIVMPANKPHSVKALERFKMVLVMIKSN